mmetsp:Transcript_12191/g.31613  ORF Transcript_12191/g.31613 Transcript_12191/m.31613 type:complete len:362 (-) Transcript_12191:320-1405(-)
MGHSVTRAVGREEHEEDEARRRRRVATRRARAEASMASLDPLGGLLSCDPSSHPAPTYFDSLVETHHVVHVPSPSSSATVPVSVTAVAAAPAKPFQSKGSKQQQQQKKQQKKKEAASKPRSSPKGASRYWTKKENARFDAALKLFRTDYGAISRYVGTRTPAQVRSHARKYYKKLIRDYQKSQEAKAGGQRCSGAVASAPGAKEKGLEGGRGEAAAASAPWPAAGSCPHALSRDGEAKDLEPPTPTHSLPQWLPWAHDHDPAPLSPTLDWPAFSGFSSFSSETDEELCSSFAATASAPAPLPMGCAGEDDAPLFDFLFDGSGGDGDGSSDARPGAMALPSPVTIDPHATSNSNSLDLLLML